MKDEQLAEAIAKCQQLIQKREEKQRAADRNPVSDFRFKVYVFFECSCVLVSYFFF